MSNESDYTREQRIKDLNTYLNVLSLEASTRSALIKQIAMVRCSDMEIANEADGILKFQIGIMSGAANGKIS